jgi:WD40 repeat protein
MTNPRVIWKPRSSITSLLVGDHLPQVLLFAGTAHGRLVALSVSSGTVEMSFTAQGSVTAHHGAVRGIYAGRFPNRASGALNLFSVGDDGELRRWDLGTGKVTQRWSTPTSLPILRIVCASQPSRNGYRAWVVCSSGPSLFAESATPSTDIATTDIVAPLDLRLVRSFETSITSLCSMSDGGTFGEVPLDTRREALNDARRRCIIVGLSSGTCTFVDGISGCSTIAAMKMHDDAVVSLCLSEPTQGHAQIASASLDRKVKVWEWNLNVFAKHLQAKRAETSSRGNLSRGGGQKVSKESSDPLQLVRELRHFGRVQAVTTDPLLSGGWITASEDKIIRFWDARGQCCRIAAGHNVTSLQTSRSQWMAAGDASGAVCIFPRKEVAQVAAEVQDAAGDALARSTTEQGTFDSDDCGGLEMADVDSREGTNNLTCTQSGAVQRLASSPWCTFGLPSRSKRQRRVRVSRLAPAPTPPSHPHEPGPVSISPPSAAHPVAPSEPESACRKQSMSVAESRESGRPKARVGGGKTVPQDGAHLRPRRTGGGFVRAARSVLR